MPNVSFMAPGSELELAQQDATRQRALADALRQQSMAPSQGIQAGQMYIGPSWTQGLAKMLQGYTSSKIGEKTDADLRAARSNYDTRTQGEVSEFVKNLRGTPAQTFPQAVPNDEEGNAMPPAVSAAQAPDMNKAMMTALGSQNPMIQGMGGSILSSQVAADMSQQRLAAALKQFGIGVPGAAGAAPTAGPTDPAAPAAPGAPAAPAQGGIPGVSNLAAALLTSGDPALAQLGTATQTAFAKGNEPVINRGFGIGRMVNGQYVPDQASLQQALDLERGKQGITAPMETPITLKLSGGQEAQLSRPEYADYQKTGQLPGRYGQGQGAGPVQPEQGLVGAFTGDPAQVQKTIAGMKNPQERANAQAAFDQQRGKGGLGVPGLTQSQPDQIQQVGQTHFAQEVAQSAAKSLFEGKDKAMAASNDLINIAEARKSIAGGTFGGSGSNMKLEVAKFINANVPGVTVDAKKVANTDYLKSTLGAGLLAQAKALGANPSNADAERINDIVGSISKDPAAMQKILDWRETMAHRAIDLHNTNVQDAESRGMTSPYDFRVKSPAAAGNGFKILEVK